MLNRYEFERRSVNSYYIRCKCFKAFCSCLGDTVEAMDDI